jgi:hydrogenase maturation protease
VNAKLVEDIANAVLYEGYMLYPYRPSSVKNRQRWNFGVVYPKAYSEAQSGADNWFMQTECLAIGGPSTELSVKARFLQAVARTVGKLETPVDEMPVVAEKSKEPAYEVVESLQVDEQMLQPWQEAVEREIVLSPFRLDDSVSATRSSVLTFPSGRECEPVRGADGRIAGLVVRTREAITAQVDATAERVQDGLFKLTVRIVNLTASANRSSASRDDALMQSLLSAHTVLGIDGGEFVSLLDPPSSLKEIVSGCINIGTWPVLVGDAGQCDAMLSSPIILYDYPKIAPESPGDLFDGTEIDEILALRILTLTDDEKKEMRHTDARARQILERTETMPAEHFMKLHGALRGLRPAGEEKP